MINYSISYRSRYVTEPDGTRVKKAYAYAKAKAAGDISTSDFAKEATKASVYGSGVLQAVLVIIADNIIDMVKRSYRVTAGSLGVFGPGLTSAGVEDIADFSANAHIKKAYVKWTKPSRLANIEDVTYRLVATNADQAAVNRAVKNASAEVELSESAAKALARTQNAPSDGD